MVGSGSNSGLVSIVSSQGEVDATYGDYNQIFQFGANDGEEYNVDFTSEASFSPIWPTDSEVVILNPTANNAQTGLDLELISFQNGLRKLKIPGATEEPIWGDGSAPGVGEDSDTLAHIDTILSNLTRMNSIVEAKHSYIQERFEGIEAERISLSESLSHFQDTDIAEESTALIKEQIRQQSAGAMVTQANSQAQFALSLLP